MKRQGLPHLYSTLTPKGNPAPSLTLDEFLDTTKDGKIHLHEVTEKTDGATFKMGYDREGFYTQYNRSGDFKARYGPDHVRRAQEKARETGKPYYKEAPNAFCKFHIGLHFNWGLQDYLGMLYVKHGPIELLGEALSRDLSRPSNYPGELRFVHTSYFEPLLGKTGAFIVHSKLPGNEIYNLKMLSDVSSAMVRIHDDTITHEVGSVDVSRQLEKVLKLDHELMRRRTSPKIKEAKLAELDSFNKIKRKVYKKVDQYIMDSGIENKFGTETEGIVVHPSDANPDAARFKVVSSRFTQAKKDGAPWAVNSATR